jgi:hypothetical protein
MSSTPSRFGARGPGRGTHTEDEFVVPCVKRVAKKSTPDSKLLSEAEKLANLGDPTKVQSKTPSAHGNKQFWRLQPK